MDSAVPDIWYVVVSRGVIALDQQADTSMTQGRDMSGRQHKYITALGTY